MVLWWSMYMFVVNRSPSIPDLRKFGHAMLLGFTAIAVFLWVFPYARSWEASILSWSASRAQIAAICLGMLGLILLVISWWLPEAMRPIYIGWMSLALPVGMFMSLVLLTLLFVLLLPLFSLWIRWNDPLRTRRGAKASYWEEYEEYQPTLERMRRTF